MLIFKNKNKKNAPNDRQAFTLIEILLIVAIVSLLAAAILVSLNSARIRAKDNSFKATMKSVQTGLVSCCMTSGAVLGDVVGGLICAGGGNYPDGASIGTISDEDCNGNSFTKTITPGTKNKGNCQSAEITAEEISYEGC